MNSKTASGIILILAIVNLFALMWFLMLTEFVDSWLYAFAFVINLFVIAFSASALIERNETKK